MNFLLSRTAVYSMRSLGVMYTRQEMLIAMYGEFSELGTAVLDIWCKETPDEGSQRSARGIIVGLDPW